MKSSIREFWQRLEGPVHPDDKPIFDEYAGNHTFDLEFPPPAFIGDIDEAPVVILMSNGGYGEITKGEFVDETDHSEHIDWLAGRRTECPKRLSTYYTDMKIFPLIEQGQIVIVNAIAYRSPMLSEEPQNLRLGQKLPSTKLHRKWLENELFPAAQAGKRLIIAHRFSAWGLKSKRTQVTNLYFSTSSISKNLSIDIQSTIMSWLKNNSL